MCKHLHGEVQGSLGTRPGIKCLGHMVVVFLVIEEISKLTFTMAVLICTPSNSKGFSLSTGLQHLVVIFVDEL